MGEQTGISWCDATFNPWWGCEKVSPACAHCYAERDSDRYGHHGLWGAEHTFRFLSDANWRKPVLWNADPSKLLPPGEARRPRVFCASMADVFEERAEVEAARVRLFDVIASTPQLDWLVLTKRPEFARDWLHRWYVEAGARHWVSRDGLGWGVLPNVWMGVSIENDAYTWRADVLREIPAPVRFISAEPLLGSLFADRVKSPTGGVAPSDRGTDGRAEGGAVERARRAPLDLSGLDWVITGGESGSRKDARPTHPSWFRELRDHVLAAGNGPLDDAYALGAPDDIVAQGIAEELSGRDRPALHFKQWGSWAPATSQNAEIVVEPDGTRRRAADALPSSGSAFMRYAGPRPKDGGKSLLGDDWCEFPAPASALTLA